MQRLLIEGKTVSELREFASIRHDIKTAINALKRSIELISTSDFDLSLTGHLYTAAITRYGRAFATGKRQESQSRLNEALKADPTHGELIRVRNTGIAHSVNQSELSVVIGQLSPFSTLGSPRFMSVSVHHERELFPPDAILNKYLACMERALEIIQQFESELESAALDGLNQLPIEKVQSMKEFEGRSLKPVESRLKKRDEN